MNGIGLKMYFIQRGIVANLLLILLIFTSWSFAQTYEPGSTYYGRNDYVEYHAGDTPLIIGAPHGGALTPSEIPDRTYGTTVTDSKTKETALAVRDAVFAATGRYPHVIISNLKRTKLDPNREIVEAAQGNQWAEQAWYEYQGFIDTAKDSVTARHGKGMFLDIHGHGHAIQRLELGYLMSSSNLQKTDSELNGYESSSSIRSLSLQSPLSFAQLLRGSTSMGAMFEAEGISSVPSVSQPDPGAGNVYFSGGYCTARHGSRDGGTIDAVQIEAYRVGLRDTQANRQFYAQAITDVMDDYFREHYGWNGLITSLDPKIFYPESVYLIQNYPNPFNPSTTISYQLSEAASVNLTIYDVKGRVVATLVNQDRGAGLYEVHWSGLDASRNQVNTGVYFAQLQVGEQSKTIKMVYIK